MKGEDIITVACQISVTKPFQDAHFNILDGVNKCGLMYDYAHYSQIPSVFLFFQFKHDVLLFYYSFFFFFLLLLRVVTLRY